MAVYDGYYISVPQLKIVFSIKILRLKFISFSAYDCVILTLRKVFFPKLEAYKSLSLYFCNFCGPLASLAKGPVSMINLHNMPYLYRKKSFIRLGIKLHDSETIRRRRKILRNSAYIE